MPDTTSPLDPQGTAADVISPQATVERCQTILSHAWMVRTFVKHSPEAEDFPELMQLPRTIFDMCRALESRKDDPPAYLLQLRKKIGRLRTAALEFAQNAQLASTHTNFQQATISISACVEELSTILAAQPVVVPPVKAVTGFLPASASSILIQDENTLINPGEPGEIRQ